MTGSDKHFRDKQTFGVVLVRFMEAYGIDTAFGIPGTHTIELYRGLPETGIRHITPRHEQGAGFMADGYARVTGRPAACFTVSGPGAMNIATAMGQALLDSIPMLVISADNATHELDLGEGRLHEIPNLQQAMRQCSRWTYTMMRPDEIPKVMARAFSIFNSERPGPVHLTVPQDVMAADASHIDIKTWNLPARPSASPAALQAAADILQKSERPVIALGGGAADAAALAQEFAERVNAPVTLTHNAKGVLPPDHPLYVRGSPSYEPIRSLYREADVIVGIGTEFAETDYDFFLDGQFSLGDARLIRIDIDASQLTRNTAATVAIHADASYALKNLIPLCQQVRKDGKERTREVNAQLEPLHSADYQLFLDTIQQALPNCILIGDSTQPVYFAAAQYHARQPRSFASSATGYGTLGYGLPAAFGAKIGQKDRPVVSLLGDGGAQFTINELATAVEASISVSVIIWNNQGYEMIAQAFRKAGMEPIACDIYTPDFLTIAEGYGCRSARATNLEELKIALIASQQEKVPTVIEVLEDDFINH